MDDRRFDDLTKLVGRRASRRSVLKAAIAGAVASVFGSSIVEAAISPIKTRPNLCIQPGYPCGRPGIDPSRDCCYKCNNQTHKCCEDIGYLCKADSDCCKTASGVQPICRDPNTKDSDSRKSCQIPGTLNPGAQCTTGSECANGNCANGVCQPCPVGQTACGTACCNTALCLTCVNGQCKNRCGPCQRCDGNGACVSNCTACQTCVAGVCKAKTCGPCQKCNEATGQCASTCGVCERCQNGACVPKCTKCQSCNAQTGACTDNACPNKCDVCNPATGTCGLKTCGPCQRCNRETGLCETTCDRCHTCRNNVCVPNCPDPCRPCNPDSGHCVKVVCDGLCETCEGGACVSTCDPDQCQQCNGASGTCADTCGPCTACDGQGNCAPNCGDCEICVNGTCEPLCGPCKRCVPDKLEGLICVPVHCPGTCQTCNPATGQCEFCDSNTCTTCNKNTLQCETTCTECQSCIAGECVACANQSCSICDDATGLCVSSCPDPCAGCDPSTNECSAPACEPSCEDCFSIPDGLPICVNAESTIGACITCNADNPSNEISACGECEFCGPDGCTSCKNLPCWTCENGGCEFTCDVCQFCSDEGECSDYSCNPGQVCDDFGGCVGACETAGDCAPCQVCYLGVCTNCPYCIDGDCVALEFVAPAQLLQISPIPTTYVPGLDFLPMNFTAHADVTAGVSAVDVTIPAPQGPSSSTSGCESADFTGFTPGDIALIQRGTCTFQQKAQNAEAAGAVAVIIFNEGNDPLREPLFTGTLQAPGISIPVVSASYALGVELYNLIAAAVTVRINTATVT